MNEKYDRPTSHDTIYSLNWRKVVEEDMNINYLREDLD